MIYQNAETENTRNQFSNGIRQLLCGNLPCKANITKSCGIHAFEVFQHLLLLMFQEKNLFWFLNCQHKDDVKNRWRCSDD